MSPKQFLGMIFIAMGLMGLIYAGVALVVYPVLIPTPTPVPTLAVTPTATATSTSTATPTPRFVLLPPVEVLTNRIAEEQGLGFTYIKYHFVDAGSEVWVLYGWPEDSERVLRAVFRLEGGQWRLVETKPMGTPAPGQSWPEQEAMR